MISFPFGRRSAQYLKRISMFIVLSLHTIFRQSKQQESMYEANVVKIIYIFVHEKDKKYSSSNSDFLFGWECSIHFTEDNYRATLNGSRFTSVNFVFKMSTNLSVKQIYPNLNFFNITYNIIFILFSYMYISVNI